MVTALLFFLTGAVALANEVLWTRFAALLVASTITTYSLTIGLVLLGIVIGGLLVSTVLSLIFVPSFYTIMDDVGRFFGWVFGRFIGARDEPDEEHPAITRSPARPALPSPGMAQAAE